MIYWSLLFVAIGIVYVGWKFTARGAYESAEYTVLEVDGAFEIREYPPLTLATTSMQLASRGDDGSFMRLFRYISGANDLEQKVKMTTPVFMASGSAREGGQMGFVMPQAIAAREVPQPSDEAVRIEERPGGRFAVIRFAGRADSESIADAERQLRAWMEKRSLEGERTAEIAGYDPPWTPGPFRRNEVLIQLP